MDGIEEANPYGTFRLDLKERIRLELYWLYSTSVQERGPLDCHRQPLSFCQGD